MEKDLVEKFAKKNEMIFRDKLELDLKNNKDTLFKALDNLFNQKFIEVKAKLLDIYKCIDINLATEELDFFLVEYRTCLQSKTRDIINQDYKELKKQVQSIDISKKSISKYQDFVIRIAQSFDYELLNSINSYLTIEVLAKVENWSTLKNNTSITIERSKDLLCNVLPKSLSKKIKEYFVDRTGAISNNALETYKRMKKINSLTIK